MSDIHEMISRISIFRALEVALIEMINGSVCHSLHSLELMRAFNYLVNELSFGKDHEPIEEIEHFGARLMDGEDNRFAHLSILLQQFYDNKGSKTVKARCWLCKHGS